MSNPLTLRGPMAFAGAVLAGGISAACLAFAVTHGGSLFVLAAYLTAIPLFIAGLGGGSLAGLIAAVTGCAFLLAILPSNYAFVYAFLFAIPAIGLTGLALRRRTGGDGKIYWYPEAWLMAAITLYPAAIFLIIGLSTLGIDGGFQGLTSRQLHEAFSAAMAQMPADAAQSAAMVFDNFIRFLPAIAGCAFILTSIIGMQAAQMILIQQKWSLRPAFSLHDLHVPHWVMIALIVAVATGAFAAEPYDYIGTNLGVIFCVPFFFNGLSVVHAMAPLTGWPTTALVIFYILVVAIVWLSPLVVLLGVSDQWVHFRRRFAARLHAVNTSI